MKGIEESWNGSSIGALQGRRTQVKELPEFLELLN